MKLTEEQRKKLLEKLNEVWRQPRTCTVCGRNEWDVSEIVFELREFHGGDMIIGGQSAIAPLIQISCKNCSHTLLFNAIKLGLIEKK